MGGTENIFDLVQPQSDDPEIIQFFELMTLPRSFFGYDRKHVIDALRSLDGLYRSRIEELEKEKQRNQIFRQEQLHEKDSAIARLKRRAEQETATYHGGAQQRDARGRIDVLSQVIPEIQQSLDLVIRKAAGEARHICEGARRHADKILNESRREMEDERRKHMRALGEMTELKKQYMADLDVLQAILADMQAEADSFGKRLESIRERPALERGRSENAWAAEWK